MSSLQTTSLVGLRRSAVTWPVRALVQTGLGGCMMIVLGWATPLSAQGIEDLPNRPIARSEVLTVIEQQFAAMDSNHDGVVTRAEFDAYRKRQDRLLESRPSELAAFERVGPGWFDHADVDEDGRVTLAEAEEHPLRLFDLADTNGDGIVSMRERQIAAMLMALSGR